MSLFAEKRGGGVEQLVARRSRLMRHKRKREREIEPSFSWLTNTRDATSCLDSNNDEQKERASLSLSRSRENVEVARDTETNDVRHVRFSSHHLFFLTPLQLMAEARPAKYKCTERATGDADKGMKRENEIEQREKKRDIVRERDSREDIVTRRR
ncbi:hypothetical protein QAD02_024259 [Eretmocerus hayati]|uniref:Uncharacterized protein n=1 Tax=Eretmocerus hayati TaxID=131215 RepID=A0ACC2PXZ5_9HYME|nr:hypothetical protein QAD02_024259 [Eretmocerus hayati]